MARRKWTDEDRKFLRENYQKMTNKEMAGELGKTVCAIGKRLGTLRLCRTQGWTPEREWLLRDNYEITSNAFLSKKLGITELAIAKKLSRLGLVRKTKRKWSKKKEEFLLANYRRLSIDELAAECGMLPEYIRNKIAEIGIR